MDIIFFNLENYFICDISNIIILYIQPYFTTYNKKILSEIELCNLLRNVNKTVSTSAYFYSDIYHCDMNILEYKNKINISYTLEKERLDDGRNKNNPDNKTCEFTIFENGEYYLDDLSRNKKNNEYEYVYTRINMMLLAKYDFYIINLKYQESVSEITQYIKINENTDKKLTNTYSKVNLISMGGIELPLYYSMSSSQ